MAYYGKPVSIADFKLFIGASQPSLALVTSFKPLLFP